MIKNKLTIKSLMRLENGIMKETDDVKDYSNLYKHFFKGTYSPIADKELILNKLSENKNKYNVKTYEAMYKKIDLYKREDSLTEYLVSTVLPSLYVSETKLSLPKIKKINLYKNMLFDVQFYTSNNPNKKIKRDKKDKTIGDLGLKTTIKPDHYRTIKKLNLLGIMETIVTPFYKIKSIIQFNVNVLDIYGIKNNVGKVLYVSEYVQNKLKFSKKFESVLNIILGNGTTQVDLNAYNQIKKAYTEAFKIVRINNMTNVQSINPININVRSSAECITRYNRYINSNIDFSQTNFYDAIRNKEYIENECIINAFVDHYKNNLMADNKRNQLTREKIISSIGITEEEFIKNGSTILSLEKIFIEYKIRVRLYDAFCHRLIYEYNPEIFDRHVSPFVLCQKNNHVYVLNNNLKSLAAIESKELETIYASANFYINDDITLPQHIMISHIDDIIVIINNHYKNESTNFKYTLILKDISIDKILFQFNNAGYEPEIIFKNGVVSSIKLYLEDITFIVTEQRLIKYSIKDDVKMDNINDYDRSYNLLEKLKKKVFLREHLSYYSESDIDILDSYRTIASLGRFLNNGEEFIDILKMIEIDVSKAYTFQFSKITKIPVFNIFDKFVLYNNEIIEDYNLYMVETFEENILFCRKNMLFYGYILKQINKELYKIINVKVASNIKSVDYKSIVDELWDTEICDEADLSKSLKKLILNVIIGMMSKGKSEVKKSHIFNNINECKYYQDIHGGVINSVAEDEMIYYREYIGGESYNNKDEMVDYVFEDNYNLEIYNTKNILYILTKTDRCRLTNGYRSIGEMILQNHNFYMYSCYLKLKNVGVVCRSVKIDAFTIPLKDLKKAKKVLNFGEKFGDFSYKDNFTYPSLIYERIINEAIEVKNDVINNIIIDDEYNTEDICNKIIDKNCLILGNTPGTGKSYICENLKTKNKLFVVPTNKLIMRYKLLNFSATSINKFFSISMGDEKHQPFDYSEYECIVFDEIYFNNIYALSKINNFVKSHPHLTIIATGDVLQLKSISEICNNVNEKEYLNKCVYSIFDNIITLNINKRFSNQEDHIKLLEIKNYIYSPEFNINILIDKYFKYTNDFSLCSSNIAYTNKTCQFVSSIIRKKLGLLDDYVIGEELINRKYIKGLSINYVYVIQSIDGDRFILKNIDNDDTYKIHISKIIDSFIYNHCSTCHAIQGSSVQGNICIYDYNMHYVSPEWVYVVITRARNLSDIYFYKK